MDPPLSIYEPLDWQDIDWDDVDLDLILPEEAPEPDASDFAPGDWDRDD